MISPCSETESGDLLDGSLPILFICLRNEVSGVGVGEELVGLVEVEVAGEGGDEG